jgi:hypothetical protein
MSGASARVADMAELMRHRKVQRRAALRQEVEETVEGIWDAVSAAVEGGRDPPRQFKVTRVSESARRRAVRCLRRTWRHPVLVSVGTGDNKQVYIVLEEARNSF